MPNPPFAIDTGDMSPEAVEIAKNELRETDEVKEKAIEELRRLLHENTNLHFRDDDDFLLIFLRPCHFYPESALKMMIRIAEFRKEYASVVQGLMPEDERSSFEDHNIVNVLTNKDQHGRRVLIVNCGALWDPRKVSADSMFRIFYLVHLIAQLETETQVRGVVAIMDFNKLGMAQVKALSPSFSKRLLLFIQDAMPLRMKQIHMINQPMIFNLVWQLFKPFIREKLKSRMFFHGKDMNSLHKHIDPDFLPADYKGNLPKINYSGRDWYPCVKDYEDYIAKWNTYGFADSIP